MLIDTEKNIEESPTQTFFLLHPRIGDFGHIDLRLEQGAHEPSSAEPPTPFHQDPSQRIAVLEAKRAPYYLIFSVGALLKVGNCGGSEIGWDEWKSCVVIPDLDLDQLICSDVWVLGSRLFSIYQQDPSSYVQMGVHDFSVQGRAKYSNKSLNGELGGLRYLSSTGIEVQFPWGEDVLKLYGGHDSVLFHTVSVVVLLYIRDWD